MNERKFFWNLTNFIFQSFFSRTGKWTIRNFKKMKRFLEILLKMHEINRSSNQYQWRKTFNN